MVYKAMQQCHFNIGQISSLSHIKGGKGIDIIHNNVGNFFLSCCGCNRFQSGWNTCRYMQAMVIQPPKDGSVHDIKGVFFQCGLVIQYGIDYAKGKLLKMIFDHLYAIGVVVHILHFFIIKSLLQSVQANRVNIDMHNFVNCSIFALAHSS